MTERTPPTKRPNRAPNRVTFTDLMLQKLKHPKHGQVTYWDTGSKGQLGLQLLVSRTTKTFRSTFYLGNAIAISRKLGRYPELSLVEARKLTLEDRSKALHGIDPRVDRKVGSTVFADVVDRFIEEHAKPNQRTWKETERVLKTSCRDWLRRPINSITKDDARVLLRGIKAEELHAKGIVTQQWLKKLWKWACREDIVTANMMDAVDVPFEKKRRTRVYSDEEIRAIWHAADKMDPIAGAYFKLLVLLAPRKTALASTRWSHINADLTLWTTPNELTKSTKRKTDRKYYTPLPPLAQRILKGLPRPGGDRRVFPTVPLQPATHLSQALIDLGAPADFKYHTV
jgi:hypothetical protein